LLIKYYLQVQKVIPDCSHLITVKCKTTQERKHCTAKCYRSLACGHKCKSICRKNCSEKPCEEIVIQRRGKLACGHKDARVLCCDIDKGNICYYSILILFFI